MAIYSQTALVRVDYYIDRVYQHYKSDQHYKHNDRASILRILAPQNMPKWNAGRRSTRVWGDLRTAFEAETGLRFSGFGDAVRDVTKEAWE